MPQVRIFWVCEPRTIPGPHSYGSNPASCIYLIGISKKAQQLYFLVFLTRYLDLFTTFYSLYNCVHKIYYILATAVVVFGISYVEPAKSTYSASQDNVKIWKLIAPPFMLSLLVHGFGSGVVDIVQDDMEVHFDRVDVLEFLWTVSICLEALSMIPQLVIYHRNRSLQTELRLAVGFLGVYRLLYVFNWIYRCHNETGYRHHYLVYFCGIIQVLTYSDFFNYESRYVSRFDQMVLSDHVF
jgi:ER lumen protein retaining receptor